MKSKICGIYAITNLINGKTYIGKSISINRRWKEHIYHLNRNKHNNEYLQNAWNKYGKEQFAFELIEECIQETLHIRELYWIEHLDCLNREVGYNLRKEDENRKVTEETKQKLRIKRAEQHRRHIQEGRFRVYGINFNTKEVIEYNSRKEAKQALCIKNKRNTNFLIGVAILKDISGLTTLEDRYKKYLLSQQCKS